MMAMLIMLIGAHVAAGGVVFDGSFSPDGS